MTNNDFRKQPFSPKSTFTEEKIRGLVASLASGATASGLNFGGMAIGLSPAVSTLLGIYIIGNFLTYVFDILFAKRNFDIPPKKGGHLLGYSGPIAYTNLKVRFAWLLKSMIGPQFFRYVISVIIDTLTGVAVVRTSVDLLDKYDVLMEYKIYRDFAVSSFVTVATFFLFVNVLRFDWAYANQSDPQDHVMNIVVLAWLAVSIMVFSVIMRPTPIQCKDCKDHEKTSSPTK